MKPFTIPPAGFHWTAVTDASEEAVPIDADEVTAEDDRPRVALGFDDFLLLGGEHRP